MLRGIPSFSCVSLASLTLDGPRKLVVALDRGVTSPDLFAASNTFSFGDAPLTLPARASTAASRPLSESSPRHPAESSSPRHRAESSSPRHRAEPSSPRHRAESASPRVHAEQNPSTRQRAQSAAKSPSFSKKSGIFACHLLAE